MKFKTIDGQDVAYFTNDERMHLARVLIDSNQNYVDFSNDHLVAFNILLNQNYLAAQKRPNPAWPKDNRNVYVIRPGEEEYRDVSWRDRISESNPNQRKKTAAMPRDVVRALRISVYQDMKEYKDSVDELSCALKISDFCSNEFTVDHKDNSFKSISEEFVAAYGAPLLKDGGDGVGWIIDDINVEANWIAFHAQRSVYQIACNKCNSKKGAK
jgi:hypothetical protein